MYTAATLENELHVLLDAAGFSQREKAINQRVLALLEHASTLRTKLAMRDQQLREADAELARLKADKASVDIAPEPWEAIVTAALRWRDGADRGELAAAVDAFTGTPTASEASDLAGLAARESIVEFRDPRTALRSEQYADGAGAQAWRQAMGGRS